MASMLLLPVGGAHRSFAPAPAAAAAGGVGDAGGRRAGAAACSLRMHFHRPAWQPTQPLRLEDLARNSGPRCGDFVSERRAGITVDTLEKASNLSGLIEQNMNKFAYSLFVKL